MASSATRYLISFVLLSCGLNTAGHSVEAQAPAEFAPGLPRTVDFPHPLQIVRYTAFTVAWDARRQTPAWTAYHLPPHPEPIPRAPERPTRFRACAIVGSPGHDAYTGSGFDRGHLVPNHAIAVLHGRRAQMETFLTINIAPQPPSHNRGPWMRLERKTFHWSQARDGLWVITGVIHVGEDRPMPGTPRIAIPDLWYTILIDAVEDGWEAKAVMIPIDAPRDAAVLDHVTTIRALEALTGFDFNPDLPIEIQDRIETVTSIWPLAPAPPIAAAKETAEILTVDINTATTEELQTLPGIGPALAERIIASRPYQNIDDLLRVPGIGPTTLLQLTDMVTAEE